MDRSSPPNGALRRRKKDHEGTTTLDHRAPRYRGSEPSHRSAGAALLIYGGFGVTRHTPRHQGRAALLRTSVTPLASRSSDRHPATVSDGDLVVCLPELGDERFLASKTHGDPHNEANLLAGGLGRELLPLAAEHFCRTTPSPNRPIASSWDPGDVLCGLRWARVEGEAPRGSTRSVAHRV
jgi:hypothetical protein